MARTQANQSRYTRVRLLQLAARMFGENGYSATTLRSIADRAGIEAPSIYHHFGSKEELVDAVMLHGMTSIVQHVQDHLNSVPASASAEDRFNAAVKGQMSALIKYGDYAMASGRLLAQLPRKVKARQVKMRESYQELWNGLVKDLQAEGSMRKDVNVALCRIFVLSAINSVPAWFDPKQGSLDSVVNALSSIFFEGVRPDTTNKRAGGKHRSRRPI